MDARTRSVARRLRAAAAVVALAVAVGTPSPALAKTKIVANASLSYAEGPGLHGGQQHAEAGFTIHAVAADGTSLSTGGDPFVVAISQPEPTPAKIKDNQDGTYTVTYTPAVPGTYLVAVTLGGDPIRDAPFTVSVKRAPSAANSFAEGPGLATPASGLPTTFTIYAVDETGAFLTEGGDGFPVDIHGPTGRIPSQTIDNGNGSYTVVYTPPVGGNYTIKVAYAGKHLKGSSYLVRAT